MRNSLGFQDFAITTSKIVQVILGQGLSQLQLDKSVSGRGQLTCLIKCVFYLISRQLGIK